MKSNEERLELLEHKVSELEMEVKVLKEQLNIAPIKPATTEKGVSPQKNAEKAPSGSLRGLMSQKSTLVPRVQDTRKEEAFLGKYIIGAFAALLIFVGASSFIRLFWGYLNEGIKIGIMGTSSLVLTVIGFKMILKEKKPIASVTLGIGAGLMFITILSSNLSYKLISNELTLILVGLWALLFMFTAKYTKTIFTVFIADIGIFVTLFLGLAFVKTNVDFTLLSVFTTVVSAVLYIISFKYSHRVKLTIDSMLIAKFALLLAGWSLISLNSDYVLDSTVMPIWINLLLIISLNLLYHQAVDRPLGGLSLIAGAFVSAIVGLNFAVMNDLIFKLESDVVISVYLVIHFIQLAYCHWRYKGLIHFMNLFYALILVGSYILLGLQLYDSPVGIAVIAIILLALERIFETKHQPYLIGSILVLDGLLLLISSSEQIIFAAIGVVHFAILIYVLWYNQQFGQSQSMEGLKLIAILIAYISSVGIPKHIIGSFQTHFDWDQVLIFGLILQFAFILFLNYLGFFRRDAILGAKQNASGLSKMLQVIVTIDYIYGVFLLNLTDQNAYKLLLTLLLIGLALYQSKCLLQSALKYNKIIDLWLVLKYLILLWSVISAFADLGISSVGYSLSGMAIAFISISIGFKMNINAIRLYGLVLTICMVVKFILVDLSGANSILRVVSLILGGILCYAISSIYNKMSLAKENEKEKMS